MTLRYLCIERKTKENRSRGETLMEFNEWGKYDNGVKAPCDIREPLSLRNGSMTPRI